MHWVCLETQYYLQLVHFDKAPYASILLMVQILFILFLQTLDKVQYFFFLKFLYMLYDVMVSCRNTLKQSSAVLEVFFFLF